MEIILKKDVAKLGFVNEIVKVKMVMEETLFQKD